MKKLPFLYSIILIDPVLHLIIYLYSIPATNFGIALPAWIVDQKNSMLVILC